MENTNLLLDFLDGTLDSAKEDQLFSELNSNEAMRGELKQYVAMDKAFNTKLSTMAPSAKSTIGVFGALGIALPTAAAAATASTTAATAIKAGSMLGKYSQAIFSGIMATALTTTAFLIFFGNSIFNNGNSNNIAGNAQSVQQAPQPPISNNVPVVSSTSNDSKPIIRTKIVYVPVEKQEIEKKEIDEAPVEVVKETIAETRPEITMLSKSSIEPSRMIVTDKIRSDNRSYSSFPPSVTFQPNLKDLSIYEPLGLSIEFNGAQYWQLKTVPIAQSSIPKFYNSGLALFYKVSDNLSFGMDIRNEHYYQQFEGTDDLGDKYMYRQYPNYLSYTGGVKWSFFNYKAFTAFSKLMAGATKTGMVGRGTLGLQYSPQPQYTFTVGLEGSFLRYTHQNNAFYSPKIGLNYGVLFNL
jgi:hypothetical protein